MQALMLVVRSSAALAVGTTVVHDEVLRTVHARLPTLAMPRRARLVVVILAAFVAHAVEVLLYGLSLYVLVAWVGAGHLTGMSGSMLAACLYFSAETCTSLGLGDVTPLGPVRLLAGVEALNGLLLIGWSASFTDLSMERFWREAP